MWMRTCFVSSLSLLRKLVFLFYSLAALKDKEGISARSAIQPFSFFAAESGFAKAQTTMPAMAHGMEKAGLGLSISLRECLIFLLFGSQSQVESDCLMINFLST